MSLPIVVVSFSPKNPDGSLTFPVGTTITFLATASDADGKMLEHWCELRNPAGIWSWGSDGNPPWLRGEPWAGDLGGNGNLSSKATQFKFNDAGSWQFRSTANYQGGENDWQISNVIDIAIVPNVTPPVLPPVVIPSDVTVVYNDTATSGIKRGGVLLADGQQLYKFEKAGTYHLAITGPDPIAVPDNPIPPPQTIPFGPDVAALSKLFGPSWADLNPSGGNEDRLTNAEPVHNSSPELFERVRTWELGAIGGDASDNWSAIANVIGIDDGSTKFDMVAAADVTQGGTGNLGVLATQAMATYSGVIAISPQKEYSACGEYPNSVIGGYIPLKQLVGGAITQATCLARSASIVTNEAWHGNEQGLVFPVNLPTSRGGGDWPLPVLRIPNFSFKLGSCGLALTSLNEILVAVGVDPVTGKGRIAFLAVEGKFLPSHTMQRMCQPNEGSWSDVKLLGVQDLPFVPNSVSASSNGCWSGPSQTGNSDLGQIDLSDAGTRAGMFNDNEQDPSANLQWSMVFANKGYAIVSSKEAGQVALFDLSPFLEYIRQSYLVADQAAYLALLADEDAGKFPKTFDERPDLSPKLVGTLSVPLVNKVIATQKVDRWTFDNNRSFAFTEDGYCYTIDCSSLWARWSWQPSGRLAILAHGFIAKNIVDACFAFYNDDGARKYMPVDPTTGQSKNPDGLANVLVVASRGERAIVFISAYGNSLYEFRRITDTEMNDLTCISVNPRTYQVIAGSLLDKKLFSFVIGGVLNNAKKWFTFDNNGRDFFKGGTLALALYIFAVSIANIN